MTFNALIPLRVRACGSRGRYLLNPLKHKHKIFARKSYRYFVSITEAAHGSGSFRVDTVRRAA